MASFEASKRGVQKTTAFFISGKNLLNISTLFSISSVLRLSMPVMCLSPEHAIKGCTIAYGSSNYDQDYQASYIAYRIIKGERVENIPFEKVNKVKLFVNQGALRELGYTLDKNKLALIDQVVK